MTDASLLLQGGLFVALSNDEDVQALAAQRVYDTVPDDPVFPYVHFATSQLTDQSDECGALYEIHQDIHVWSKAQGMPELKQLCAAIREAAKNVALDEGELVLLNHISTRYLTDPNPAIRHGVITFQAKIYLN